MKLLKSGSIGLLCAQLLFAAQNEQDSEQINQLKKSIDSLKTAIENLQERQQETEREKLQELAEKAIQKRTKEKDQLPEKKFQERSRSLQALNPEISVTGDFLSRYLIEPPHYTEDTRTGFQFRVLELRFQSNLDPFSMAKVIMEVSPEEIGLAEAYMTWINPLNRINITVGKFRQQFGVVNRWHSHALDQVNFPLPITLYMGEEGLNQTGLSLSWLMPRISADANELTFQLTNSSNEALFSGEEFSLPAALAHWKNYYDLNRNTYFEWGITGLAGTNDNIGFTFKESHRWTYMGGLDLTVSWFPADRALYKGLTWRSELFYLNKELSAVQKIKALGGYSYLDYRLNRRWIIGLRGDLAQPPVVDNDNKYLWQIVPYITFWQSEYVYIRLEYSHLEGHRIDTKDNRFTLQIDWSVGPHKHEKY